MKNGILIAVMVVFLGGCAAGPAPVWQQDLNNLHRYHRDFLEPVKPVPAKVSRPDYSAAGLYSCGLSGNYR